MLQVQRQVQLFLERGAQTTLSVNRKLSGDQGGLKDKCVFVF